MISFLQLHETLLFHNILNGSFSGSPQSCFILGGQNREQKKVSLETNEELMKNLMIFSNFSMNLIHYDKWPALA